jgi:hypothetical protein
MGGLQVFESRAVETSLEVFPNPLSLPDKLSVQTNSSGQLVGFDALGRQVFSYSLNKGTTKLTLPIVETGVYLLRLTANNSSTIRRIVIY